MLFFLFYTKQNKHISSAPLELQVLCLFRLLLDPGIQILVLDPRDFVFC